MESVAEKLLLVLLAIVSGGVTYWWGKRAKIDEIRIRRVHDLVEQISVTFQDVHGGMERLGNWFESNFKNLNSVAEGVERFRELADTTYAAKKDDLEQLAKAKATLSSLVKQGQVYLPEKLLNDLTAYMETCSFQFSNVWPLFDTYLEGLFANILNQEKRSARTRLEEKVMKKLRKVRS
jgi:hypothetical protein